MKIPDLFNTPSDIPPDAPPVNVLGNRVVTLHVSGESLDPDAVTNLFRISPTESERKGLPQVRADGSVESRVPSAGRWSLGVGDSGSGTLNVNEAIETLIAMLPEDVGVWRQVAAHGALHLAVTWAVHPANSEVWLEARRLGFLAERGVGLYIEAYQRDPDLDAPNYV